MRLLQDGVVAALAAIGLTAVIETATGAKSYWALHHPAEKPDFHHRNGFIHEIGS